LGKRSVYSRHFHKQSANGNAQVVFSVLFFGVGIIDFGFAEKSLDDVDHLFAS
jgi:hypothetical protein